MTAGPTPDRVQCSAVSLHTTFKRCAKPAALVWEDGRRTELLRDGYPVCRNHSYTEHILWAPEATRS